MSTAGLYEQIKNDCGYLKLDRAGEVFATLADDAKAHHWTHVEFLARLLDEEAVHTRNRRLAARLRYARFPFLDAHLDELTTEAAPTLREINGVGPQNAAALLTAAGDNPDRLRTGASFAALCGTSPIDASSGRQQRHRLNRGGDRQANCARYYIVMSRLRWHQPTKTYMARRVAQGRTTKEVIRCLKRYVAIEVHRAITVDLGRTRTARPSQIAA